MADDTEEITDEVRAAREAKQAELAAGSGGRTTDNVRADYFGAPDRHRVTLPDGVSWVEHQGFNEGAKRKFLNSVNKDVKLDRVAKTATVKLAGGDDRYNLLKLVICDWDIYRNGQPFQYSAKNLETFLNEASTEIVDLIEADVREKNPWLDGEASVEDLKAERDALDERIAEAEARAEGK